MYHTVLRVRLRGIDMAISIFVSTLWWLCLLFAEMEHSYSQPIDIVGGENTVAFYLLHNGTDTEYCGHNASAACASFSHLLHVFHEEFKPRLPGLAVIMDVSVTIDNYLQTRCPWLSGLKILFSASADGFLEPNKDTFLTLENVNLAGSYLETRGLDMSIVNSTFTNFYLKFHGRKYKPQSIAKNKNELSTKQRLRNRYLNITNSNLIGKSKKSLLSLSISNAQMYYKGGRISGINQSVSILNITNNSNVVLRNLKFLGNSVVRAETAAVLSVHQSNVSISSCTFNDNTGEEGGAIYAYAKSSVNVENCTFEHNYAFNSGGAIYATRQVNITLRSSRFTKNKAYVSGGAIFSTLSTNFKISLTSFTKNNSSSGSGGSIGATNLNHYLLTDCIFAKNSAGRDGAVMYLDQNNSVSFKDTVFHDNFGEFKSGVLRIQHTGNVTFKNCNFVNNTAVFSEGVISVQNNVSLIIDSCLFRNNTSEYVGVLEVRFYSTATVVNSVFVRNSITVTSIMHVQTSASLSIISSLFHDHLDGCLLLAEDESNIDIKNSSVFNRLGRNPVMVMVNSDLTIEGSAFINNSQPNEGGIVLSTGGSKVAVTNSNFSQNYASKGTVFYMDSDSQLVVKSSMFVNNSGGDGVVAFLRNSSAVFLKVHVENNKGFGYGGTVSAHNSRITFIHSKFINSSAVYGGCIMLQIGSSLAAYHSVFEANYAREGGAIFKYGIGNVSLVNCSLIHNKGIYGGSVYFYNVNYVRLAQGFCRQPLGHNCITFERDEGKVEEYKSVFYTYNYTLYKESEGLALNSAKDKNFLNTSRMHHMVYLAKAGKGTLWLETFYASLLPVPCGERCRCYYIQDQANMFDCSGANLTTLPDTSVVPNHTEWHNFSHNLLNEVRGSESYFHNTYNLVLSNNSLDQIHDDLVESLRTSALRMLDLSSNQLKRLPRSILQLTNLTYIWLSNNPFKCDCSMLWMANWMDNFTLKADKDTRIVRDYYQIKCKDGILIHKLDPVQMGCSHLTLWQKILIGISAALIIAVVIAIIAISRRWNAVKFFIYLHFDILDKNDGDENLDGIKSDALLSYSERDENIMRKLFMETDEQTQEDQVILEKEHGFKLILHQRDFRPGAIIMQNIAESVEKTRRMITLLSRNYLNSNFCMEEFRIAHHKMVDGNKKYLIVILLEPLDVDTLPEDMKVYLQTYTYIDATKHPRDIPVLMKRVRFGMPGSPLSKIMEAKDSEQRPEEMFLDAIDESRPLLQNN